MPSKDRKKIFHIACKHNVDDARIFTKECASLAKKDEYDVTFITSDINSPLISDIKDGVRRMVLKAKPKRVIRQFEFMRQVKKIIADEGDVALVHLHETTLLLLAMWLKRRGIKVIYDSHEDYHYQIRLTHSGFLASMYYAVEKYVCRRIDAVIFPCRMLDKQVFDYGVKRLEYIDNYPIIDNMIKEPTVKTPFCACYTGTLSKERGVLNNVAAWQKADVHGILAGRFYGNEEKEAIEGLNDDRIEYLGVLPHYEIGKVYDRASVGMSTLLDAGQYHKLCNLPTKVGEYMMNGIPTIIYRNEYIEQVMSQYEFGLMVDPDNIDEIADAIVYLRERPTEVIRMAENGIRAVKEFFNWGTQEKKLYSLYDDILSDRS